MAHRYMSHGTHMNESWQQLHPAVPLVRRSHIQMSHGTHMDESWHIYEAHIWNQRYVYICASYMCQDTYRTHMNTYVHGTHTSQWKDTQMSHDTHTNESWHTHKCVMAYPWIFMAHIWISMAHIWISDGKVCVLQRLCLTISRLLKIIGLFCRI